MNNVKLYMGNSLTRLKELKDNSIDSIVTDPPYEIGYSGHGWDSTGIAYSVELWAEALRVLKPGGHLLSFGATRTWHRMAVAVEDAGFEIRDNIAWLYASGMPKSQDISKAIDKRKGTFEQREVVRVIKGDTHAGAFATSKTGNAEARIDRVITRGASPEAQRFEGWGTALRPSFEPIVLARKSLPSKTTIAENVLNLGTGAININDTRLAYDKKDYPLAKSYNPEGRWTPNVTMDEVTADGLDEKIARASRYFYVAKPSGSERPVADGKAHPTVKPLALMQRLIRLVTPPGGVVLDIFAGSGSTLEAAALEGFDSIGFELTEEYVPLIKVRAERSGFNLKIL